MYELAKQNVADRIQDAEHHRLRREARRARTIRTTGASQARHLEQTGDRWWRRLTLGRSIRSARATGSGATGSAHSTPPPVTETERRERVDIAA